MSSLKKLLAPESVAIIGASRKPGSLGKMFLDAILQLNYTGKLFLVNPKANEIEGIPCYPEISRLPTTPDLAVILLPKDLVIPAAEQLAQIKTENIVVISAGFKETGPEGIEREKMLVSVLNQYKIRAVGPNSMGLFNTRPDLSFNGTFSPTPPTPGHVGFISQSGALGVAVLELACGIGPGFSIFVSTGNKADITDHEILEYLKTDSNTHLAMLYMESIDNPAEFRKVAADFVKEKPLLILKAGRTKSGLKAASSHTGALASDDVVSGAFLKQCGAIRCDSLQELMETARVFENQPLPAGNRVAIVTNAGGPGILATDALESLGLKLAEISDVSKSKMREFLPAEASVNNPVDMIASANHETYKNVCAVLAKDKMIDAILVIIVKPPVNTTPAEIAENLTEILPQINKPVLVTLMAVHDQTAGLDIFYKSGIPVFNFPEAAARTLSHMVSYKAIRTKFTVDSIKISDLKNNPSGKPRQAAFEEISDLFNTYNLPVCRHIITSDINEARQFFEKTKPVAMKVANEEVIHKSDAGLVRLNIETENELTTAFAAMLDQLQNHLPKDIKPKIVLQEMVHGKIELVIGARQDPNFGPVLMFGLGGIFVELFKDVAFRVLPVSREDIIEMIGEIKSSQLLRGFRGNPEFDEMKLAELLLNTARLLTENPQIKEMDMNPLIWADPEDYPVIVDFRMSVVD